MGKTLLDDEIVAEAAAGVEMQMKVLDRPHLTDSDVLTIEEAAKLFKVSESGLKSEAEAGRIPSRQIAGEWRFSRQSLLNWLHAAPLQPQKLSWSPSSEPWTPQKEAAVERDIAELQEIRQSWGTIGDRPGEAEADE